MATTTIKTICEEAESIIAASIPDYLSNRGFERAPQEQSLEMLPMTPGQLRQYQVYPGRFLTRFNNNAFELSLSQEMIVDVMYTFRKDHDDAFIESQYFMGTDEARLISDLTKPAGNLDYTSAVVSHNSTQIQQIKQGQWRMRLFFSARYLLSSPNC